MIESIIVKVLIHLLEKGSGKLVDLILDAAILRKAKDRKISRHEIVSEMLSNEEATDEDYLDYHRRLRDVE